VVPPTSEAKLAPAPIVPIDDSNVVDNTPTRVMHAVGDPKARSAPPPAPALLAPLPPPAKLPALRPPPASLPPPAPAPRPRLSSVPPPPPTGVVAHAPLPPPPRTLVRAPSTQLVEVPGSARRSTLPAMSYPSSQSVPPVALSEPPDFMIPMRHPSRALYGVVAAAGFGILVLGAIGIKSAFFGARAPGSLVTTVFAEQGDAVQGAQVYVDGALRCDSSPCRVDNLTPGSHFVKVAAPGYVATAAEAVSIRSGENSAMRLEIARAASAPSPSTPVADNSAPAPAKTSDANQAVDATSLPTAAPAVAPHHWRAARRSRYAEASYEAPRPAAPTSDKGIMLLTSSPAANVVVDGRPLGQTPKAVRVRAGVHTVVFAGADGRVVRSVRVGPGSRQTVAATF
jgi:PEGA domain